MIFIYISYALNSQLIRTFSHIYVHIYTQQLFTSLLFLACTNLSAFHLLSCCNPTWVTSVLLENWSSHACSIWVFYLLLRSPFSWYYPFFFVCVLFIVFSYKFSNFIAFHRIILCLPDLSLPLVSWIWCEIPIYKSLSMYLLFD